MSEQIFLLPDVGNVDKITVSELHAAVGSVIKAEATLLTLESEKAAMDIPAPYDCRVKEWKVQKGAVIGADAPLAVLEKIDPEVTDPLAGLPQPAPAKKIAAQPEQTPVVGLTANALPSQPAAPPPPALPATAQTVGDSHSSRAHASPSVRKLARELGVDLGLVYGSGAHERIRHDDVKAYTKAVLSGNKLPASGAAASSMSGVLPAVDFSKFGAIESKPLSRLKRLSGQALVRNWMSAPHVTQFDEADITDLENFRQSKLPAADAKGVKLTLIAFLLKAAVTALEKFADFNASLSADGEQLVYKKYFHIGVAVNTENGLVVPVVRDVDQKGLFELAREVKELGEKARAGKLLPSEMQGGCFTISSLGGVGGGPFTPIINLPEVAILGVSRAQIRAVYRDSEVEEDRRTPHARRVEDQHGILTPRLMLPFALSYDHRVIDGVAGAQFTRFLSAILSDIRQILL